MSVTPTEFHLNPSRWGQGRRSKNAPSILALFPHKEGTPDFMCVHTGRSRELPTSDCTVHSKKRGRRAITKLLAFFCGKTNRGVRTDPNKRAKDSEKKRERERRDSNPGLPPGGSYVIIWISALLSAPCPSDHFPKRWSTSSWSHKRLFQKTRALWSNHFQKYKIRYLRAGEK